MWNPIVSSALKIRIVNVVGMYRKCITFNRNMWFKTRSKYTVQPFSNKHDIFLAFAMFVGVIFLFKLEITPTDYYFSSAHVFSLDFGH